MDKVMHHPMPITYRRPAEQRHAVQFTKNNVGTLIQALVHLDVIENLTLGEEAIDPGFGRRERVTKPCLTIQPKKAFYKQYPHRFVDGNDGEVHIFENEYLVLLGGGDFLVMSEQEFEATCQWGMDDPEQLPNGGHVTTTASIPMEEYAQSHEILADRRREEPRTASVEEEPMPASEEDMAAFSDEEALPVPCEEREEQPRAKRLAKRNRSINPRS